jgi:hypothetical protein
VSRREFITRWKVPRKFIFLLRSRNALRLLGIVLRESRHNYMGRNPMPNGDDYRKGAGAKPAPRDSVSSSKPRSFALGELLLRPADKLDLMIRRWVIPHDPLASGSVIRASVVTRPVASRTSTSVAKNFMPGEGVMAIGRYLRAEYDLQQPIPARLVELLSQLEGETRFPGTPKRA